MRRENPADSRNIQQGTSKDQTSTSENNLSPHGCRNAAGLGRAVLISRIGPDVLIFFFDEERVICFALLRVSPVDIFCFFDDLLAADFVGRPIDT